MTAPGSLPPPARNLRHRAARGARWTAISTAVTTALQLVQLSVLGRLLEPRDFGLMALVLIVLNFAQLFGQVGLSGALIQRKEPTREERSSLYWLNAAFSVGAFFLLWAASQPIAWLFGAPELAVLMPVAALSFLLVPFGFQFRALAQKELRFRLLAGVDIMVSAVALVVAASSAWFLEWGVWSLVWGYLVGTAAGAAVLVAGGWREGSSRPLLRFRRKDLAGYLGFGLYRTGSSSVNYFNLQAAQLCVGALLGAQALGFYNVASNLALQPFQKLGFVLLQVSFPVFSKVQDDVERLRRGYLEVIRLMVFASAPILVGLAVVAPTAVPLLLGEQWTEAVPLVQVLAFYALLRSLGTASGGLLMARGKANWSFYWNLFVLAVIPPTVYLATLQGGDIVRVAQALVVSQLLLLLIKNRLLLHRLIGPCFGAYLVAAGVPVALACVMGAAVLGTGTVLMDLPDVQRLVVQVLVGMASYGLLSWLFQRKTLTSLTGMLRTRG